MKTQIATKNLQFKEGQNSITLNVTQPIDSECAKTHKLK